MCIRDSIYIRSRRVKVDSKNVNAEWEGTLTAGLEGSDEIGPPSGTGPKVGTTSPRSGSGPDSEDTVSARNPR